MSPDEFQRFFSYEMDIHNLLEGTLQRDQEALKEHENVSLNLSRIHTGSGHYEDRPIKHIYL